ncbi:MAG TPA: hypothetical protein VFJ59_11905 [Pseudolabrys sp.]|nr:hypothetical protein [Pseudolabrys sp.]
MQSQDGAYNLCWLSYFAGYGLRPIAGVTFAAALTIGLVTAPMSQLMISAAALQQQASAPDKRSQLLHSSRARERQKKHRAEWNEAIDAGKI